MPKLLEDDWQKIYSNISMITFFQGKNIGLTKYNGYCVLNSTNHNEYVNPNLMYFINGTDDTSHYYHDIRCSEISSSSTLTGYKIGDFQKKKLQMKKDDDGIPLTDASGNILYDDGNGGVTTSHYKYNHNALACYKCINGPLESDKSVYEYVRSASTNSDVKEAYFTSLARERYNTVKLLSTQ